MSVFIAAIGDYDIHHDRLFDSVQKDYSTSIRLYDYTLLIKTDQSADDIACVFLDMWREQRDSSFEKLRLLVTEVIPGISILPSPTEEDMAAYQYIIGELSP